MADFLTNINLHQSELQNARIQNLAADPGSGVEGQIYNNTVAHELRYFNGTTWVALSSSSGLTQEQVEDFVGAMVSGNTETGITVTYDDPGGKLNFAVTDSPLLNGQNAAFYLARANHTGTQLAATISDFDSQVRTSRLDQMAAPTADVSLNSHKLTNVTDPTSAQDAATKAYVDAMATGLDLKASVRAATTAAGTLASSFENGDVIDGVTLATGDRILIKNQASGAENGIYTVNASGAPTRATDADANAEVTGGLFVFVEEGTTNADSGWVLTNNGAIVVGTTALTFAQFSGAGQITAGNGLTKTGNTLDVVGTAGRISVAADSIDIDSGYVGQATITTLGTITTGVWTGTAIAVANGGTGGASAATAKTNLGFMTRFAADIGDGSSTTITVTHNLGTRDVVVSVYDKTSNQEIFTDVVHATTNTVTIATSVALGSNAARCVVVG